MLKGCHAGSGASRLQPDESASPGVPAAALGSEVRPKSLLAKKARFRLKKSGKVVFGPTIGSNMVEAQEIVVPLVNTLDNDADFFTKPLAPKRFKSTLGDGS